MSSRYYDEPDYQLVHEKQKTATQPLPPSLVSKAIHKECKSGTYGLAEELFEELLKIFKYKQQNPNYYYSELDIIAMQRGLSSLIRYAPDTDRARYYFCYSLRELEDPVRTVSFEVTILNNLLFIYSSKNDDRHMRDALEIVKVALEINVFQVVIPANISQLNARFNDPLEVFETLCKKVLRYFRMEFNEDKTAIRPQQRLFSH